MKKVILRLVYTLFVAAVTMGIFLGYKDMKRKAYKKQLLPNLNWAKKVHPNDVVEQKRFVVTVPSYRNELYYEKNLRSIFEQKYDNYRVIYVDDASPDNTYEKVKEYVTEHNQWDRFTLLKNDVNRGAMFNHVQMSQYYDNDEIVVMLDGDDFFASDKVLQELNRYYANPNVWATYGQYITYPQYEVGLCKPMTFSSLKKGNIRDLPWVTSALRTFYGGLFRRIHMEDFLYEGYFLPMACDLAYMFPVVEMGREHVYFTADIGYIYNRETGINDDTKSRSKQVFFEQYVRTQPRYEGLQEHPAQPFDASKRQFVGLDVVIFSLNKPMELYATLQSLKAKVSEIGETFILYEFSGSDSLAAYEKLMVEFPFAHFVGQHEVEGNFGFKEYLGKIMREPSADHVLFLADGSVVTPSVSLAQCIEDLCFTGCSCYFFQLEQASQIQKRHVLPLPTIRKGLAGVALSPGLRMEVERCDDAFGAIYRKELVSEWLENVSFLFARDFQKKWSCHDPNKSIMALCQNNEIVVSVYDQFGCDKEYFASTALKNFLNGKKYQDCFSDKKPAMIAGAR